MRTLQDSAAIPLGFVAPQVPHDSSPRPLTCFDLNMMSKRSSCEAIQSRIIPTCASNAEVAGVVRFLRSPNICEAGTFRQISESKHEYISTAWLLEMIRTHSAVIPDYFIGGNLSLYDLNSFGQYVLNELVDGGQSAYR